MTASSGGLPHAGLLETYPQPGVHALIERKRVGEDKGALEREEAELHRGALDALEQGLHDLCERSRLPERLGPGSPGWRVLDDFLVRVRDDEA